MDNFLLDLRLHSFRPKGKLNYDQKVSQHKGFCYLVMSSEDTELLEFNQYQKSNEKSFNIYAVFESLIIKTEWMNGRIQW